MVYLVDQAATLAQIRAQFAAFVARIPAGDTLLVHFFSHGGNDNGRGYLCAYDTNADPASRWMLGEHLDVVRDRFAGAHVMFFVDACHSGTMADELRTRTFRSGVAVLASALPSQLSTGNWTFTNAVIDAYSGAAYLDRDTNGAVTLSELVAHAADDMAIFERQNSAAAFSQSLDRQMALAPTAARPQAARYGERVEVSADGNWYKARIVDSNATQARIRWIQIGYDSAKEDQWVNWAELRTLPGALAGVPAV